MDLGAHGALRTPGDELPPLHTVPHRHHGLGGGADVHFHGDLHPLRRVLHRLAGLPVVVFQHTRPGRGLPGGGLPDLPVRVGVPTGEFAPYAGLGQLPLHQLVHPAGGQAHGAGIELTDPALAAQLCGLHVLVLQQLRDGAHGQLPHDPVGPQGVPQEVPGAQLGAVGALDAGGPRPVEHLLHAELVPLGVGSVGGEDQNAGGGLGDDLPFRLVPGHGAAHHGPAGHDEVPLPQLSPRQGDALGEGGAHGDMEDRGLRHPARHGEVLVRQGLPRHGVMDGQHRGGVVHHRPHRQGDAPRRNGAAGDLVDQDLLVPGGVEALQQVELHRRPGLPDGGFQGLHLGSIGPLHADGAPLGLEERSDGGHGLHQLPGVVGHDVPVRPQQGLALHAVDDEVLHLAADLLMGGEARAAAAHHAGGKNQFREVVPHVSLPSPTFRFSLAPAPRCR